MAQWYYAKNGQQLGPVDEAMVRGLLSSGQLSPSDLVWTDGMGSWVPLSTVPELAGTGAGGFPAAPYPTSGQQYPAQPLPYGGYVSQQQYAAGSVPNYLVQAILVTVFCCWPLGIPAIVYAAQVNGKLARGDYAGAVVSSNNAKKYSWISFGLGLVVCVVWFLIAVAGGLANR
jgi:hypothetical protein